jgi:hypothetical protein
MCGQYLDVYEQIAAKQKRDVGMRRTLEVAAESI